MGPPNQCWFLGIFVCTQSGNHPKEDVGKMAITPKEDWALNQSMKAKS
jgi:hypothetical protein